MSYLSTLSPEEKKNLETLVKRINAKGITNPYTQGAILAVVTKEGGFKPKSELSYRNTSNARLRLIFGNRLANVTEADLSNLKKNDVAFFDQIYGPQWSSLGFGNNNPGDGFKYRGRGYNQLTGKAAYDRFDQATGVNLVTNPDLANDPTVAADILIEYFKQTLAGQKAKVASLYNSTGINDFKTLNDAYGAIYHANAGFGSSQSSVLADKTGLRALGLSRAPELLTYAKSLTGQVIDLAKKKPALTIAVTAILTVSIYFLYKALTSKKDEPII